MTEEDPGPRKTETPKGPSAKRGTGCPSASVPKKKGVPTKGKKKKVLTKGEGASWHGETDLRPIVKREVETFKRKEITLANVQKNKPVITRVSDRRGRATKKREQLSRTDRKFQHPRKTVTSPAKLRDLGKKD